MIPVGPDMLPGEIEPCVACAISRKGTTRDAMLVGIAYQIEGIAFLCDACREWLNEARTKLRVAEERVGRPWEMRS